MQKASERFRLIGVSSLGNHPSEVRKRPNNADKSYLLEFLFFEPIFSAHAN